MQDQAQNMALKAGLWARHVLAMGLGLLALALITGGLGNLSQALNGLLAVGGLLGLALFLPRRAGRTPLGRLALALVLMVGSLPVVAGGEPLGLFGAALFFFALSLLAPADGGSVAALLLTALFFALYRTLAAYVPALWYAEQWLAINFSWFVGGGLMLGPTASGFHLFVLFALFASSVFLHLRPLSVPGRGKDTPSPPWGEGKRGRTILVFAAWIAALVLAVVAFIWLQPRIGSWLLSHWPAPATPRPTSPPLPSLTYLESPLLLFALLWLASALASLGLRPAPLALTPPPRSKRWEMAGLALLALATVVLTLDPPSRPRRGTILFHDSGHLEWGRPTFGRYGPHSGGSFGLWPDYLAAYGYKARRGPLTAENLEGAEAVVLINLPEKLDDEETERLLAFVKKGGGLVIWGEHTGVGRIRRPINDLLAHLPGAPIRLRFDSAVPMRQGWAEGLTLLPHPAVYGVQNPIDLVIAVGASLEINPPARPIIVGRFGHSDKGDVTNRARNYVGDMRYNPGERLGDVVLAAEIRYGEGHVVVLGDTTPLGSVNLMTTMPFHVRLLDWITADRQGIWGFLLRNGWLAALLLVGAGVCLALGRSRATLAAAALVLGLTLTLTTRLNEAQSAPPTWAELSRTIPTSPIAYVDVSHQERFDRVLWEETSIGGLDYNLMRNGSLPLLLRRIDADVLAGADLLVVVAPGQRFTTREVETIAHWVERGGRLLVSVGWEESEASQDLLAAFGLAVGHIPLGPIEVERDTGPVRFHEAWPVTFAETTGADHGHGQAIVEGYGYPLAAYQPWGEGGVVLIGDSAFLLGGSLEGQSAYQEGNIFLLRDILQGYLGFGEQKPTSLGKTGFYTSFQGVP